MNPSTSSTHEDGETSLPGISTARIGILLSVSLALAVIGGWAFAGWQVHGQEILNTLAETGLQGCL